nr:DUF4352 domain-containing protein [Acidobacteriota bacterium]
MNTNVNLEAAVGVLALLGTAFVMGLAVIIVLHSIRARRRGRARAAGLAALALLGFYLLALVAFSFLSREKVLAFGEEKHFCEIDCHLAYSVTNIRKTRTLGGPGNEATAKGVFYVVTIRTRFDETTISPGRGEAPLTPNSRVVTVSDGQGNSYDPSPEGERALDALQGRGTPLTTPLHPGESYTTDLVFDLPVNITDPRLLIREGEFITHFIIGHENSFW